MKRLVMILAVPLGVALCAALLNAAEPVTPVTLKTTEFGHGSTIVLLHGLASGRMVWMPTAKKLLAGHRVVMVDLPGHGDSPLPDPFSLEACVAALDQVLAKQNPDSTVLVAHGMGGLIALEEVQAHPERVKGLAVIDGSPRAGMKIPEQQQQFFFQMMETSYDDVLRRMIRGQSRDTLEAQELLATAQGVPPATVKAYIKAAMNADASAALKGMKPAFLFIASERRWPKDKFWATLSRDIGYDGLDSTTATRRIAGAGALIMKQQPDSLAAVVDAFAARAIAKK